MGAGANWRGRGPGRIEAAADRGAYLRGIDARHLRSGDPRRRRLGRRRRAPANPHARRRELSLPGLGAGWLPTPPPRARASSPSREGAGALAIAWVCGCWLWGLMPRLFVKPPPRLRSYGNEDGDAAPSVYPSPAGKGAPFYRPTIFRIAPVVPVVFANWSVLPGMLVYANPK